METEIPIDIVNDDIDINDVDLAEVEEMKVDDNAEVVEDETQPKKDEKPVKKRRRVNPTKKEKEQGFLDQLQDHHAQTSQYHREREENQSAYFNQLQESLNSKILILQDLNSELSTKIDKINNYQDSKLHDVTKSNIKPPKIVSSTLKSSAIHPTKSVKF